jgi:hypothetical protein
LKAPANVSARPGSFAAPGTAPPARQLAVVGPVTTFVIGILLKVFDANFSPGGYALLAGFAALGVTLQFMPQRARHWNAPPTSAAAGLKQSLGTLRTIIAAILVIVPAAILTTNDKWLGAVPTQFNTYVSGLNNDDHQKDWRWLRLQEAAKPEKYLYIGEIELTAPQQSVPGDASGVVQPRLRVIATDKVIGLIAKAWVGGFYIVAFVILLLTTLFSLALYFGELIGDMNYELGTRPRRT